MLKYCSINFELACSSNFKLLVDFTADLPVVQLHEGVLWEVCVGAGNNGAGLVDDIMLELPYRKGPGQAGLQSPPDDTVGAIGPHQEVVMHLECRAPNSSSPLQILNQTLNPADSKATYCT